MQSNNHGPASKPGPFQGLSPERILQVVESEMGITCSNLCRSYNSYINRVFEIADTDGSGLVVKFYRPDRWSAQALQDEHDFLLELAEEEIPVLAPLPLANGRTLGQVGEVYFAVFPKKGGRLLDELNPELWLAVGRLLGRMHMVGARTMARNRIRMHPTQSTASQVDFICRSKLLPEDLISAYTRVTSRLIEVITPMFAHSEMIRIHGDCHRGNLIQRPGDSLYVLDFDDMAIGPPVQDLWMLLPGPPEESAAELDLLLEGYETFRQFDYSSLRLIEPLRAMRYIHYCAWCAHQVVQDGATAVIPDFASRTYWQKELEDLQDQLQRIEDPPRPQDFSGEIF